MKPSDALTNLNSGVVIATMKPLRKSKDDRWRSGSSILEILQENAWIVYICMPTLEIGNTDKLNLGAVGLEADSSWTSISQQSVSPKPKMATFMPWVM